MKKILKMRYIIACFAMIGALVLQSCNEEEFYDVVGSTQNKVYVNTRTGGTINIPKNSFVFNVANTPLGSVVAITEKVEADFAVQSTHKSANDVMVGFEVDNTLILDGYTPLPASVPLAFNKTEVTIPRGSTISSEKINISINSNNLETLEDGSYMVAIKISSVTNADKSNNLNIVYLIINTVKTNVYSYSALGDMVGSLVTNKTGWTGTVDATIVSGSTANMFSGTNTFWRVDPGDEPYDWWVDMASLQTGITGIRIHVNNAAVNFTRLHVYSSNDGETWHSQGITDMNIGTAFQYIKFYSPIDAQYLKFTVLGRRHATQTRVAIFDIYTQ